MSRGKYHKEDCKCRLCSGETGFKKGVDERRTNGFQKGVNYSGEKNGMFGVDRKGKCPWVSERNKKMKGILNSFFGKKHTEKTKKIQRIKKQKQIILNGGSKIGKNEKDALDSLEKLLNIKIIRQFPICGYFVDGYCKEKNMVIEIDEEFHKNKRPKDKKREDIIIKKLKCKFIRIKDYE